MKLAFDIAACLLACLVAIPASAKPVVDCPNRDQPFSSSTPLIDLLLNPSARALIDNAMGGRLNQLEQRGITARPPTVAATLTLETAGRYTGFSHETVQLVDQSLRSIPVTDVDRTARCSRYDDSASYVEVAQGRPRLLLFEKIVGFKDQPSVEAARATIIRIAERNGWGLAVTENAGTFNSRTLARFDAVIWNNISGDVLTLSQRYAFSRWLERGGGFFGLHGSAGDPSYSWDWYVDKLIGARFIGHPIAPRFQTVRIAVNSDHPLSKNLPPEWNMTDEWYSFRTDPRAVGAKVLLFLDETTYRPIGADGMDLRMPRGHPIAWSNCIGRGRMFYSAVGHLPASYNDNVYERLLEDSVHWASERSGRCRK